MQVHGAFVKRKSFDKLQPQMPKRKISQNSRQGSKRKHRTQHKSINSPQIELKAYKRKNIIVLNQFQTIKESESILTKQKKLQQLRTNRTKESINLTQQSTVFDTNDKKTINQSDRNYSFSKNSQHINSNDKKINLISREELTSRFTINHNEVQEDSLTNLIHHAKSKNSNPLINTARLIQDQINKNNGNVFGSVKIAKNAPTDNQGNRNYFDKVDAQNLLKIAIQNDIYQNARQSSGNVNQNQNEFQQKQSQQGQNFDDYQFGGGQNSNQFQGHQDHQYQSKKSKFENKLLPPKVKAYGENDLVNEKPQNWREINRYIPRSQSQHRMGLQIIKKQKAALQSRRQQQQIVNLLQEYHMNKNSIHLLSQRKIQSNKIIQNFYRQRRINSEKRNSNSLPLLKAYSQPKNIILVPQVDKVGKELKTFNLGQGDSMDTMIKKIEQKTKIKSSSSFSKLGFGSSNPRGLSQQDINQNQLQNVRNIQKKLRQKGIQFNVDSIRKGLLHIRDGPVSKISKNGFHGSYIKEADNQNKFQLPQKQLPSNGFYKIFPL